MEEEDRVLEAVSGPSRHSCSGAERGGDYHYKIITNNSEDISPLGPVVTKENQKEGETCFRTKLKNQLLIDQRKILSMRNSQINSAADTGSLCLFSWARSFSLLF